MLRCRRAEPSQVSAAVPDTQFKEGNSTLIQNPTGKAYIEDYNSNNIAADPVLGIMSKAELEKQAKKSRMAMLKASKEQNYLEAARLRDEWQALLKRINEL